MTDIRPATPADMDALIWLGAAFHAAAPWASRVAPFDPESFRQTAIHCHANGRLLVADRDGEAVGMVGGAYAPVWFNHAHRVASEVFLYVDPEHRVGLGRGLMRRLEDACRADGMRALFASAPADGAVGDLFERMGFAPTERAYTKVL